MKTSILTYFRCFKTRAGTAATDGQWLSIKVIQGKVGLPSVESVHYYVYTHDAQIFV